MMNKYRMCVLSFVMLVGLCARAPQIAAKDALIAGLLVEAVSLDPAISYEATSIGMFELLYDKLFAYQQDDATKIVPKVAESYEISADGKTIIIRLRPGIRFANGNPLNADAVVFSLRRVIKLAAAPSWIFTQLGLSETTILKVDDATVQLVLNQPYSPQLVFSCLTTGIGSIIDPIETMAHEQNGDMGSAWLEEHSAGSGAFILAERRREDPKQFTLTANPAYWNGAAQVKQIIIKDIPDAIEQAALMEQGQLDIAFNLTPDLFERLSASSAIRTYQTMNTAIYFLGMNLAYAPLAKPEVRDAIRYALDYDGLVEVVMQSAAVKTQSFIQKGMLGYTDSVLYRRDIPKAKALLASAGYPNGFEVELKTRDLPGYTEIALKIVRDLAEIGVNVRVKYLPDAQFFGETWSAKRDSQLTMTYWGTDYPDPDCNAKGFAHSDHPGADATIQALAWWMNYVNPETSKLVELAALESNAEKRAALYQKIVAMIQDDGPFAVFAIGMSQYAARTEISSFVHEPDVLWIPFPPLNVVK